jgi:hypothetical protein
MRRRKLTHFTRGEQASNCVLFRERAYNTLVMLAAQNNFSTPDAAGKCHGSHPDTSVHKNDQRFRITNAHSKMKPYQFALVMENSVAPMYVTEKIMNAFASGAIPIWYGTTDIFKLINKDSFIFYNISHPEDALEQIKSLQTDALAYAKMMARPIFANGHHTLAEYMTFSDGPLQTRIRNTVIPGIGPAPLCWNKRRFAPCKWKPQN